MELAFLFIKGRVKATVPGYEDIENSAYKVFKDSSFNFSNEYEISFDDKTGIVKITKNDEFIPNFFDESGKLSNVNSLVGMNGSGKSSVLSFVKSLTNGDFRFFPYKFLAVFRIPNRDMNNEFRVIRHDSILFNPNSNESLPLGCYFSKPILLSEISSVNKKIPDFRLVYLSNVLEIFGTRYSDPNDGDVNVIDDISSTGLLNKDVVTKLNKDGNFSFSDCYHSFRLLECKRQLNFLLNKEEFNFIKFPLPRFVQLQPDLFYEAEIQESFKQRNFGIISTLFSEVEKATRTLKEKYHLNIHKGVFYYLIRHFSFETSYPLDVLSLTTKAFENNNISNDRIKAWIRFIIRESERRGFESDVTDKLNNALIVLEYIENLPEDEFTHGLSGDPILILDFDANREFFKKYTESLFITGYMNLEWRFTRYSTGEFSSGEQAIFSFFSRFHDLQQDYIKYGNRNSNNLLILIDEGDQLLHPEWQREFLHYLFEFLPKVFSQTLSIQLIITSHSPFITSDLPRYSLIYLEKGSDGLTKVVKGKDKEHTLGANIHQLYRDSFYLPNSMMGEFARRKIDELIKEVQGLKGFDSQEQKNMYLKRADMIGERFLSRKIIDLINSKGE